MTPRDHVTPCDHVTPHDHVTRDSCDLLRGNMDTSLARDTAKGVACETTGRNLGEFRLHGIPSCMIDTKSQQKHHL